MASPSFIRNVILKALLLFLLVNLVFAALDPLPAIGRLSAYNHIFPGRVRLPYGDKPDQAYNLSLFNLPAMFASHELGAKPKTKDEFRLVLIGDSSVWGFLLKPNQTLSAYLNAAKLTAPDGRLVRVYNIGYPTMSLTKDLLMLDEAMHYQPDMVVWLVTLESFPYDKQLSSPILQHNPKPLQDLIRTYSLKLNPDDPALTKTTSWGKTILGERRALADILRLQLYGILWAATGVDQYYPETYEPPQKDLAADETFHGLKPPQLYGSDLAFDVLKAGVQRMGAVPILIVNEPVYLSSGQNSNIRYNFFYPRWAYDQYRQLMTQASHANGWNYLDLWNIIPADEFTNSAIHLTPSGTGTLADKVGEAISLIIENSGAVGNGSNNP